MNRRRQGHWGHLRICPPCSGISFPHLCFCLLAIMSCLCKMKKKNFFFLVVELICVPISSFCFGISLGYLRDRREFLKIMEGKQNLAPAEGEFWCQRFGVSVVCVSCGINTISTWFFMMSPRKFLWVITMNWHPDGPCTVRGLLLSGWELAQMGSTSLSHPRILCIAIKLESLPFPCKPIKEGYIPQRSS